MTSTPLEMIIDNYLDAATPNYGILISGKWGSGKTYTLTKILKDKNVESIGVSLFGLQTKDQVFEKLLTKSSIIEASGTVINTITKAFKVDLKEIGALCKPFIQEKFINDISKDTIIVLDDLERALMTPDEIFAVIDELLKKGLKIIAIMSIEETEEKRQEEILKKLEKVFKTRINITPNFIDLIKHETNLDCKPLCNQTKEHILKFTPYLKDTSLRIVTYALHDLEQLLSCLNKDQIQNRSYIESFIHIFLALNIEYRSCRLTEEHLNDRDILSIKAAYSDKNDPSLERWREVTQRYDGLNLRSDEINSEILYNTIVEQKYDQTQILNYINETRHFQNIKDIAPWILIWNHRELTDSELTDAKKRLFEAYDSKQITETGPLLHTFALKLIMSHVGEVPESQQTIINQAKSYIQDLKNTSKLDTLLVETNIYSTIHESFGGYCYFVLDETRESFEAIKSNLEEAQLKIFKDKLKSEANSLLALMEVNPFEFMQAISEEHGNPSQFGSTPILYLIEPEKFWSAWKNTHPKDWRYLKAAINSRYTVHSLKNQLKIEQNWLQQLLNLIKAEIASTTGLGKAKFEQNLPREANSNLNYVISNEQTNLD